MRPIELTIDGFRSFGSKSTFSWEGRGLVGVVGPIGSGKSSILDAVAFALYARVPAFESNTKRLINQRRDECHVGLTFEVDGRRFAVERAMRRKGAAGHVLREIVDGDAVIVSDKAREIAEHVEALLGLDFDAFRRSVLLAQNRFAEFLQATPAQRDAVLEGVFPRFGRIVPMRDRAKGLLGLMTARLETTTLRRKDLAGDAATLEQATVRRSSEVLLVDTLETLVEPIAEIDRQIDEAAAARRGTADRLAMLTELAKDVPGRDRSEPILTAAADAAAVVERATVAETMAVEHLEQARSGLAVALEGAGGRDALTDAARLVDRLGQTGQVAARETQRSSAAAAHAEAMSAGLASARGGLADSETVAAGAAKAAETAAAAVSAAETGLHDAQHRSMAATLRGDLIAGDPCPVCDHPVAVLPDAAPSAEVDAATAKLETSRATAREAAAATAAASMAQARAAQAVEAAVEALALADEAAAAATEASTAAIADVEAVRTALIDLLGEGDPADVLSARLEQVRSAEGVVAEAEDGAKAAAWTVADARTGATDAATALSRLTTSLATLAGRLRVEVALDGGPEVVRSALVSIREEWMGAKTEADAAAEAANAAITAATEQRRSMFDAAGLAADVDLASALGAARATLDGTDREIGLLEARLAELTALEERESDTLGARDRLQRMVDDLAPSRFLRFVLDEKRRVLAALGSERLEELSGGRYRFTDDGGFEIVDLMAAERARSAASLSGGETFLASLALALALAEMVGREGGRLDAFFLDEGFGSLDPEHIDLAMDGIERLVAGAGDRLVVVVSHVPALRERIEDLVVLDKDAMTGDTVVRRGANPGEDA